MAYADIIIPPNYEVYKILELAGIIINKPGISTYGKGEKVEADNIRKA